MGKDDRRKRGGVGEILITQWGYRAALAGMGIEQMYPNSNSGGQDRLQLHRVGLTDGMPAKTSKAPAYLLTPWLPTTQYQQSSFSTKSKGMRAPNIR